MNKNTKFAIKNGFSSLFDMNKGDSGHRIKRGIAMYTARPAGKRKWVGAKAMEGKSGSPQD